MQPTDLPRFVCDVVCAGFFANFAAQCVDAVMIREPPWLTLLLLRRERVAQTARHWRLPEMDREGQFIDRRSEEHTSELQSLMRISYAVFCLKNKKIKKKSTDENHESK